MGSLNQTKQTVQDPINGRNEDPLLEPQLEAMVGTEQLEKKKIPLEKVGQPIVEMGEGGKTNILPRRMGKPNGNGNGDPGDNKGSYDYSRGLYGR